MATCQKYSEELKADILAELQKRNKSSIKDLSERYKVPEVVINEWVRQEISINYIKDRYPYNPPCRNKLFLTNFLNHISTVIKAKWLLLGVLSGIFALTFLTFFCYGKADFKIQSDPTLELAPKIDSLIINTSRIENKLQQQIDIMAKLSSSVTNITKNTTIIYRNPSTRSIPPKRTKRKNCCCCCCKCDCEKTDSIK